MSVTTKRRGPNADAGLFFVVAVAGSLALACCLLWLAVRLSAPLADRPAPPMPLVLPVRLAKGTYLWPGPWSTGATVLVAALTATAAASGRRYWQRRRPAVDRAVPYLANPRDLRRAVEPRPGPAAAVQGLLIGRTVRGSGEVRAPWDLMHLDIWGPRTGKTATRAIPGIVSAPGNVVVTSNKRDVVDATRGVRAKRGPVWVFDPQQQAREPAAWWWNPLGFIDGSEVRADLLAGLFASVQVAPHQRSDGYFEPAGRSLLAHLMLAADADGLPITEVFRWLTRPSDDTPTRILQASGHDLAAAALAGVQEAPAPQRAGVFGTAAQLASFLTAPSVTTWITPGRPGRPEFKPKEFAARSDHTAYLLSEESNWAAAPVVLALTSALAYAHEGVAIDCPGGRLTSPALFVLDEAANVCPWPELPSLYSHLGSRGIGMMITLQSWDQGAAVWGQSGMAKLWGSAGVRVYGGGASDLRLLDELSQISGMFEPITTSLSGPAWAWRDRVVSRASRPERVLNAADLGALPRGRAFVQLAGMRPLLVRTVPWWDGPYADEVRASIARHGQ